MRVVIDTNILVEGLSRKGTCGRIIDLWVENKITPCVSTALALEYEAVLTRNLSEQKVKEVQKAIQALLTRVEFTPIIITFRPSSPDPDDDLVIDCAMNGHAAIVTSNIRDFKNAAKVLGFMLLTPSEFLNKIREK